jgi:hypothetical protein
MYDGNVIVHPNSFVKQKNVNVAKHFVFDLDETIGSFSELNILWKGLVQLDKMGVIKFEQSQNNFNIVLDIYPEFLRYGIITIMEFLFHKKKAGKCGNIYIYTNNQCDPPWVDMILNYIENKRNMQGLFESIICAFKINNIILNPKRTTNDKTYSDFIKCTLLPPKSEICFLDNSFFPKMNVDQVFYIQPMSYVHGVTIEEMIQRLVKSRIFWIYGGNIESLIVFWNEWLLLNECATEEKTQKEHDMYVIVSRKIMYLLQEFFTLSHIGKAKTRKNMKKITTNFTRKKR